MTPKPKVEVARQHLTKAQEEADGGDLRDAVQWAFAAPERPEWSSSSRSAAGHPHALEPQHLGKQLEVAVGVQHPEAPIGGRGRDQVVGSGDATPGAEVAASPERGAAHRGGDRCA